MQNLKKVIYGSWISLIAMGLPLLAKGQSSNNASTLIPQPPNALANWGSVDNIGELIMYVISNILLPVAGLIAVLFIIIGGYQYLVSGANPDLAKRAKQSLTGAVLGLVIIILSYVIVRVVARTLGAH
jgi:hypothetical protein